MARRRGWGLVLLVGALAGCGEAPPAGTGAGGVVRDLAAAVRHKIQTRLRKEKRNAGSLSPEWEPASPDSSPSHLIQEQDFKETVRARLAKDKQQLFDLKSQGLTWDEIAERVGGRADALRMRLNRSITAMRRGRTRTRPSHPVASHTAPSRSNAAPRMPKRAENTVVPAYSMWLTS